MIGKIYSIEENYVFVDLAIDMHDKIENYLIQLKIKAIVLRIDLMWHILN